jgi:hypothetical protein
VPSQDFLRLRDVIIRLRVIGAIHIDKNDRQFVRPDALLNPLDQRESLDAGVSGDAPDIEEERLATQGVEADLFSLRRLE